MRSARDVVVGVMRQMTKQKAEEYAKDALKQQSLRTEVEEVYSVRPATTWVLARFGTTEQAKNAVSCFKDRWLWMRMNRAPADIRAARQVGRLRSAVATLRNANAATRWRRSAHWAG